jgi:hypothetical protein
VTRGFAMRSRKLRWVLVLAGLFVALAAGMVALWPRSFQITEENCDQIREGLSRAEVEAILGAPPDDYRSAPSWLDDLTEPNFQRLQSDFRSQGFAFERWHTDDVYLSIVFDPEGRVVDETHCRPAYEPKGLFDTVRWRAKRQWHRLFP